MKKILIKFTCSPSKNYTALSEEAFGQMKNIFLRNSIFWMKVWGIIFISAVFFILPIFAKAANLGERTPFFVENSYDLLDRSALMATLQEVSAKADFYTEDEWWNSLSSQDNAKALIRALALEFDQKIYPKLTQVYGSPWEPGIDNDPRITILISRIKEGAGGYFNSGDEYTIEQVATSNEREMIYLNSMYLDSSRAKSFLAHEFQHLITFYQKD